MGVRPGLKGWVWGGAGSFPAVFCPVGIFPFVFGQKGLLICSASIPTLGILAGLLHKAQSRNPCISWGLHSWPYRLCS